MTQELDRKLFKGAGIAIQAMGKISQGDPALAIGMLLLGVAILAKVIGMPRGELRQALEYTIKDVFGTDEPGEKLH